MSSKKHRKHRKHKNSHIRKKVKSKKYRGGGNSYEIEALLLNYDHRMSLVTEQMIKKYGFPNSVRNKMYVIPYNGLIFKETPLNNGLTLDQAIQLIWTNRLDDATVNNQVHRDIGESGKYDILLDGNVLNLNKDSINRQVDAILSEKFLLKSDEPSYDDKLLKLKVLLTQNTMIASVEIARNIITSEEHDELETTGSILTPGKGVNVEQVVDGKSEIIEKPINVNIISNRDSSKKANIFVEGDYNISNVMNPGPNDEFESYCTVSTMFFYNGEKNAAFFLWKKNECSQQARTSINNIILGSIGAAVVATGAVVGTLFGVGVLGGKSKKKRKTRNRTTIERRKKRKTTRKTRTKKINKKKD